MSKIEITDEKIIKEIMPDLGHCITCINRKTNELKKSKSAEKNPSEKEEKPKGERPNKKSKKEKKSGDISSEKSEKKNKKRKTPEKKSKVELTEEELESCKTPLNTEEIKERRVFKDEKNRYTMSGTCPVCDKKICIFLPRPHKEKN